MKAETRGLYLAPESIEENRRARAEEKAARKRRERLRRSFFWALTVLTDMALIAMILHGLIDQRIGLMGLAVAGAALARGTK